MELNHIAITGALNCQTNKYFKFALFLTRHLKCESKVCINCLKMKLT